MSSSNLITIFINKSILRNSKHICTA